MRPPKLFFLITFLLMLGGCSARDSQGVADEFQRWTEYVKDYRTNICFLRMRGNVEPTLMVPCTPEVERVLLNPRPPASMR
jgi:hypothetical protein